MLVITNESIGISQLLGALAWAAPCSLHVCRTSKIVGVITVSNGYNVLNSKSGCKYTSCFLDCNGNTGSRLLGYWLQEEDGSMLDHRVRRTSCNQKILFAQELITFWYKMAVPWSTGFLWVQPRQGITIRNPEHDGCCVYWAWSCSTCVQEPASGDWQNQW